MTRPQIVSRDEWQAARLKLLAQEKEAMRAQDAVTAQRRELPMVRIDKEYLFEGSAGKARLIDLFEGRRQLLVYHFMWNNSVARARGDQAFDEGCPSCSFTIDHVGHLEHLHASDTTLVLVSRAPLAEIERFQTRMGWTIPWYSSAGGDFNYDFHVTNDESVAPYTRHHDGVYRPHALQVLTVSAVGVARVVAFLDAGLFALCGLPPELEATGNKPD